MLHGFIALLLFYPSARAAEGCEAPLARPGYTREQIQEFRRAHVHPFPSAAVAIFLKDGLPELHRIAVENDLSIFELLEDIHATLGLVLEIAGQRPQRLDVEMRNLKAHVSDIHTVIGRAKLKANHYAKLQSAMNLLMSMALMIMYDDFDHHGTSHVNPFAPLTAGYVTDLLTASEDGQLSRALTSIDADKRAIDAARAELSHRRDQQRRDAPPATNPATAEPIAVPADEPSSVDDAIARLDVPEPTAPVATVETNLGLLLQHDEMLRAEAPYDAHTARGTALTVTLAPYLLKQHDDGDRLVIRRLLRSVLVGRSHAGIKMLHGVGPKVIEVKGILHGHKRILGCLEGRSVRLLRLIDIKADGATYARRIPKDMCG